MEFLPVPGGVSSDKGKALARAAGGIALLLLAAGSFITALAAFGQAASGALSGVRGPFVKVRGLTLPSEPGTGRSDDGSAGRPFPSFATAAGWVTACSSVPTMIAAEASATRCRSVPSRLLDLPFILSFALHCKPHPRN
ncbi:hypothetical protein [Streptomyces sp. NPDC086782]|uniref:hypothetical protein n=1 Tax=Streptomyces sp. NPDC086782 TaxID=3365757 RepID=UPI0037FBB5C8